MHQRDHLDMSPNNHALKCLFSPNAASSKSVTNGKRKYSTAFKQQRGVFYGHDDPNYDMMANQPHTYTPVHQLPPRM